MSRDPGRAYDRALDIIDAIKNIRSDIGSMNKEQFLADGKTQRAVIESLIVIGEAANRIRQLSPTIEEVLPTLWETLGDAYDMRIILTHEYFRVEPSIVWDTTENHMDSMFDLLTQFVSSDKN